MNRLERSTLKRRRYQMYSRASFSTIAVMADSHGEGGGGDKGKKETGRVF